MSLELLLIRHGKAEEGSSDKDHTKRKLTTKGKEEFTAFASSMKDELRTDTDVLVWTSPLKRAKQTATILTEQMEWDKADKKNFLANGDFNALMNDIANLKSGTRLVCIGHEPTLGHWVEELTGSKYSFKKGGMVMIRLNEDQPEKGTLLWDKDPKSIKK